MNDANPPSPPESDRRGFIGLGFALMGVALVAAYGTLAAFFARFLYPAKPRAFRFVYVMGTEALGVGDALTYRTPGGATVAIARTGKAATADSFIALSSVCPHLGCQVHWEALNDRFFCPCHNGTFDATGKATGGPPAEAGQSLPRYRLMVERGLLYIELPVAEVALGAGAIIDTVSAVPCSLRDICRESRARG